MKTKEQLRKKFFTLRKKKYFDMPSDKFYQLTNYIKKKYDVYPYDKINKNLEIFQNKYLKKSFWSKLTFSLILRLSNNRAIGKTVMNPTTNLAALKVKGPILSIPVS